MIEELGMFSFIFFVFEVVVWYFKSIVMCCISGVLFLYFSEGIVSVFGFKMYVVLCVVLEGKKIVEV